MRNVNNWHWVDKNCINWTRDYWKEKLTGLSFESAEKVKVEIDQVCEINGDVDLNQRKGKVITIFDFSMELKWKGESPEEHAGGRIKIPEYMHDSELSDIVVCYLYLTRQFDVSTDADSKTKAPIVKVLKEKLLPMVREKFASFTKDLIEAHKGDVYIQVADKGTSISSTYKPAPPAPELNRGSNNTVVGALTDLDLSVEMIASSADVYSTLLDKQRVCVWTRSSKSIMEAKVGSEFLLFDGNISGTIVDLEVNKKIVQKWRLRSWPKDHYSTVTFTLDDKGDSTMIKLVQTGVPVGEKAQVKANWNQYYFNPIKGAFGFGANL